MPRKVRLDKGYLVAYPQKFPGVAIPLLTDEECRLRGIEPGRFPPRVTWTQEQRDAADRLAEILLPHVLREVMQIMLAEMGREPVSPEKSDTEVERDAALGGIQLVDSGKWKQRDTTICFPVSWIRQVLELFAQGKLSLVDRPPVRSKRRTSRRSKTADS